MKVNNSTVSQSSAVRSVREVQEVDVRSSSKVEKSHSESTKPVELNISSRSELAYRIRSVASELKVDEARVLELQKKIDSGQYRLDSDVLAEKIVLEHLKDLS